MAQRRRVFTKDRVLAIYDSAVVLSPKHVGTFFPGAKCARWMMNGMELVRSFSLLWRGRTWEHETEREAFEGSFRSKPHPLCSHTRSSIIRVTDTKTNVVLFKIGSSRLSCTRGAFWYRYNFVSIFSISGVISCKNIFGIGALSRLQIMEETAYDSVSCHVLIAM
ncbi:hypothetical protein JTE90_001322 [Oedothorax gibbosus]|uniref:Uncharacterized protein n=1 Tax=Oedothorax gibbosus TaxID=931172 RepID=A0AAV6U411_9ARAC|nr:hypothetical protein JTE90_001322 [Oedothorax gibbosus]